MRLIRLCTLLAVLAALIVPVTPASADHFGESWLWGGKLEGTLTYESHESSVDDEWQRTLSYTLNFPSGEITDLEFSWTDDDQFTWYDPPEVPHQCESNYTHSHTGPGAAAYWTPNARANIDGHLYGWIVDPVEFPSHWVRTYSGDCPGWAQTETGDHVYNSSTTVLANCATGQNDGWSCATDDRTQLVGSSHWEQDLVDWAEYYDFTWDVEWTPPEECAPAGSPTSNDSDGDRLANAYETNVLNTDPGLTDTDQDCYGDAYEVASGSDPAYGQETPDTLARGKDPLLLDSSGDTGSTCGTTKFKWVTPSLKSLGVAANKPGCIYLYSNGIANKVADYAIKYGPDITTTLQKMTAPYLSEIYGKTAVDWANDKKVDAAVWGAQRYLKKGMRAGLTLSRLNAIFTAGKVAGLNAIALGGVWKLNQIRNKGACIQVRIGTTSTGSTKLSWSLVYSADQVTDEKLSFAGTWKRKDGVIDQAVRAPINLQCSEGSVVASGGSAAKVFSGAVSHIS